MKRARTEPTPGSLGFMSRAHVPEVSPPATTYCHGCAVTKTRDAVIALLASFGGPANTLLLILSSTSWRLIKQYLHPQRPTSDLGPLGGRNLGMCFVCQDRVKWKELIDCPNAECTTRGKPLCYDCINFSCESGHLFFAHGF